MRRSARRRRCREKRRARLIATGGECWYALARAEGRCLRALCDIIAEDEASRRARHEEWQRSYFDETVSFARAQRLSP